MKTMKRTVTNDLLLVLLGTAMLLTVPLLAMQFSADMHWDWFDFAVTGVLLAATGCMYVAVARTVSNRRRRALIGVALAVALLVVYLELAVGVFGTALGGSQAPAPVDGSTTRE